MALSPKLKEMVQRYHLQYHLHPSFYKQDDHIMVGAHFDEGILGPIYFDYGGDGQYADRRASPIANTKGKFSSSAPTPSSCSSPPHPMPFDNA